MLRTDEIDKEVQILLDRLNLPDDDRSFARIISSVEQVYGKPIRIIAHSRPDEHSTGYWIDGDTSGTIMYRAADTDSMQLQTVLHECIHAIGGHCGCSAQPESEQVLRSMLGAQIISIRARSVTSGPVGADVQLEEAVAERGAFALAEWLRGAGSEAAAEFF